MGMDKPIVYKELENIYTACMSRVIASACEKAWGGLPEGAFGKFCALDRENTDKENAERDQRRQADEENGGKSRKPTPKRNGKSRIPTIMRISAPLPPKRIALKNSIYRPATTPFCT